VKNFKKVGAVIHDSVRDRSSRFTYYYYTKNKTKMTKNDNNDKNNYSKLKKILLIPVSIKIYPG